LIYRISGLSLIKYRQTYLGSKYFDAAEARSELIELLVSYNIAKSTTQRNTT
jgi:hypothetical protein